MVIGIPGLDLLGLLQWLLLGVVELKEKVKWLDSNKYFYNWRIPLSSQNKKIIFLRIGSL